MIRKSKKTILMCLFTITALSCTNQMQSSKLSNNLSVKSLDTLSSRSPEDYRNNPNLLRNQAPPKPSGVPISGIAIEPTKIDKFILNRPELNYPDKNSIVPGMVSIIFKNSYQFKVDKKLNKLISQNSVYTEQVNKILNKYKVKNMKDFMPEDDDISKLDEAQKSLSAKYSIDFPKLSSIHCYVFPENTDTIKLSEELRKLPFVDAAYPSTIASGTSTPQPNVISRQSLSDIHKDFPAPGSTIKDPYFISGSEKNSWAWFNHHKIFQAWDIYKRNFGNVADISNVLQTNLPIIAVIDDGFYKGNASNTDGVDAPTYLTGSHYDSNGNLLNTDTSPNIYYNSNNTNLKYSHGTSMANIIASPKGNYYGLCGVIPNARIYPIKMDYLYNSSTNKYFYTNASIISAINKAATLDGTNGTTNVDAISISVGLGTDTPLSSKPLSYDPAIDDAIQTANSRGRTVVISAGNALNNLDAFTDPSDHNTIVVGGSSSFDGKMWSPVNTTNTGTNFGHIVSLAAQADSIYAPTWNASTNTVEPIAPNDGTSPSTAIVSGVIGMAKRLATKKGINYTPDEMRKLISYTGTLGVSTLPSNSQPSNFPAPSPSSKRFLGMGLTDTNNNINLYAEMRDLNAWAALTIVENANNSKVVRIYNSDDYTWATTNNDWNNRYTTENYFDESFWAFPNTLPSGTSLNFFTNNVYNNGSIGYQIYNYGKFDKERIYGVLAKYDTSTSTNPAIYYNTVGPSTGGWFGGMGWAY